MLMTLSEAAQATGGTLKAGSNGHHVTLSGVSIDSRSIAKGQLFIALKGEHFDGHAFLHVAQEQGAAAVMVEQSYVDTALAHAAPLSIAMLVVSNTCEALGKLAGYWRKKFTLPLIGVTGSNGKTSVKEMIAAILRAQAQMDGLNPEESVLATIGNLNNDIGMPLMLLKLHAGHRAAVIEMGMNHAGEIRYLTNLAHPTVALVNNAQRAHLAGLGSLADVARAKGEIFEGLDKNGIAVINADDPHYALWRDLNNRDRALAQCVSFGLNPSADVSGHYSITEQGNILHLQLQRGNAAGKADIPLHVLGTHTICNALAATAASLAAGVSLQAVQAGLAQFQGVKARLQVRHMQRSGACLIDDTYNANPDSVRAAIDVLATISDKTINKRILVLGDMGEIGQETARLHEEIGEYAKDKGINLLLTLGEQAGRAAHRFGVGGQHFSDFGSLVNALDLELTPQTTVLVKGSRFMRMERIVDKIVADGLIQTTH